MKLTKRKAFNFLRSYFDVLNELEKDSDKLDFLMAIINKQFLDEDPKDLNFIVNLCYCSQRHQIESSVKGWKRVKGDTPPTNPPTIIGTNPPANPKEEEEEVEVEVEVEVEEEVKKKVNILMSEANASDLLKVNGSYFEISKAFYDLLIENSKKLNVRWIHLEKTSAEKFTNDIRLMCEQDGRTKEDLKAVWAFLKVDDFWMQNIQSSKKIREKFDQLITKSKNGITKNGKTNDSKIRQVASLDPSWQDR